MHITGTSPHHHLDGFWAPSGSVSARKACFLHLGVCSSGNESDLDLERKFKEEDRERAPRRPRTQRTEKVQRVSSGKEAGQASRAKKPIVSVVLTAHEAIPGDWDKGVTRRGPLGKAVPRAA